MDNQQQAHNEDDARIVEALVQQQVAADAALLTRIMASNIVDTRMVISPEERQQALAIKAAILAEGDLEPLSDFMYAQIALLDRDDIATAVDRARHLQTYREEYEVKNVFEQGVEMSKAFNKQHPGHILSISNNPVDNNYVIIYDQANFDDSILKNDANWKTFISYGWYLYHALNPDLAACRQGVILIAECEGLDWKKVDPNTVRRVWSELIVAYPVSFKELKMFHTGVAANLMAGLMKNFVPSRIHRKFNLGCQFEGRLTDYYRIPTEQEADARVQAEFEAYLHKRYYNELHFKL